MVEFVMAGCGLARGAWAGGTENVEVVKWHLFFRDVVGRTC